jgi:hypothetical protein
VNQDKTIAEIFGNKKGGFFVDLASNDAVDLSNTLSECGPQTWWWGPGGAGGQGLVARR